MRTLFKILLSGSILILYSCGNETRTPAPITSDSTVVHTPEALKLLNKKLLDQPNNAELYYQRAKYYFEHKDFSPAQEDILKAIRIDSTQATYFITLSDIYFVANKTGNAKNALEKAIQLDDKNIDALLKMAELYFYVKKNEKSIEYINMALRLDQYNAKAYFMKGMNYKEMKDTARAISSMQTAVEQDQKYYHAYIQLGLLCAAQKNTLAIQYYKNAIRLRPDSPEAWYNLGKFYQDIEDWKNALGAYHTLLKYNPNHKYAAYNLGAIHLLNLKKYDLAINYFTEAIKNDSKYIEAYYGRGLAYQLMGDSKTAVIDFQACISINPKYEPALQQLQKEK